MKLQDIAKLLSNKINQEHYVLHYLQQVYNAGLKKGKNLPPPAVKKTEEANAHQNDVIDELLNEVRNLIVEIQQASVSLIQRRFSIDYERASKIMDQLEKEGVVGPFEGSKERKVIISHKE